MCRRVGFSTTMHYLYVEAAPRGWSIWGSPSSQYVSLTGKAIRMSTLFVRILLHLIHIFVFKKRYNYEEFVFLAFISKKYHLASFGKFGQ